MTSSSPGSVKKPGSSGYLGDSAASESEQEESNIRPLSHSGGRDRGVEDPELRDVMDKINTSFPREGGECYPVKAMRSWAANKVELVSIDHAKLIELYSPWMVFWISISVWLSVHLPVTTSLVVGISLSVWLSPPQWVVSGSLSPSDCPPPRERLSGCLSPSDCPPTYLCISICPSVALSVGLSLCVSMYPCLSVSICLLIYLSVYLSIYSFWKEI